ncbi:Mitochondrial intermediate peptidase [Lobulomyces angularis]|nr:Mitochondrial intermediate peptidase [Lobulomyces angularis]
MRKLENLYTTLPRNFSRIKKNNDKINSYLHFRNIQTQNLKKPTPLQSIFDNQEYFRKKELNSDIKTGIFQYEHLQTPMDFETIVKIRTKQADKLVDLVCKADSIEEIKKTVKRLDRLSDMICSVVDMAEVIRHIHPSKKMAEAANAAHVALSNYLNRLNTHQKLYEALGKAVNNPAVQSLMSEQEKRVGALLTMDFENSGIHMPAETRKKFVELNDLVLELGQEFVTNSNPSVAYIEVENPYKALAGIPVKVIASISKKQKAIIPIGSNISYLILKKCENEETRKAVFIALNSGSKSQVECLDLMLKTRGELARLLSKKSYAELHLSDKMAKNPENVMKFLLSLSSKHKSRMEKDKLRLQDLKRSHTQDKLAVLQPWDRYFYAQYFSPNDMSVGGNEDPFHKAPQHEINDTLSRFFSVGNTFEGLSRLFSALYGVKFVPGTIHKGETWHPDVRKLEVIDEVKGKIGVVYCDVFSRDTAEVRKYENAAHFTVRCSRRIDQDENLNIDGVGDKENDILRNAAAEINVNEKEECKVYQMPIVVLVTSFYKSKHAPSLLSLSEVETLFHEMGHAMHSMLARSDFQHISGTRCAMDFVEVPSILTEFFAKDPLVLCSFAEDYETGEKLSPSVLSSYRKASNALESLENQHQIQLAILDQVYHAPENSELFIAGNKNFSSTDILRAVQNKVGVFPYTEGTAWQIQFSHLLTYGSSYYSYFWSRMWAQRLYQELFSKQITEQYGKKSLGNADKDFPSVDMIEILGKNGWRDSGQIVKTEILEVGGGRDPSIGNKLGLSKVLGNLNSDDFDLYK